MCIESKEITNKKRKDEVKIIDTFITIIQLGIRWRVKTYMSTAISVSSMEYS